MEREIWAVVTRTLKRFPPTRPRGAVYTDREVLAVAAWAALHDRPICWACKRANWPPQAWRRRLPDQSTMSRRLRQLEVQAPFLELVKILNRGRPVSSILLVDGKAFEVGEHTTDPDAKIGRGVSRFAKGYKLHMLMDDQTLVLAWQVHPLNKPETRVAQGLLREAADQIQPGSLLLADAAYDSNPLHLRAAVNRVQLIAPRQTPTRGVTQNYKHHRSRLKSIELTEGCGSDERNVWFRGRRVTIERFFGNFASVGGGLISLPAWARRLHRCRIWIGAKLFIHAARLANA